MGAESTILMDLETAIALTKLKQMVMEWDIMRIQFSQPIITPMSIIPTFGPMVGGVPPGAFTTTAMPKISFPTGVPSYVGPTGMVGQPIPIDYLRGLTNEQKIAREGMVSLYSASISYEESLKRIALTPVVPKGALGEFNRMYFLQNQMVRDTANWPKKWESVASQLEKNTEKIGKLSYETDKVVRNWGAVNAQLKIVGTNLLWIAGIPLAAVAGLGVGFGMVVKTVAPFEASMTRLRIISEATTEQIGLLNKEILNVAVTYGASSDEMAAAAVDMAKQGFTVNEMLYAMRPAAALAINSQISMQEAMNQSRGILKAFNLDVSEVGTVMDYLYVIANAATINVENFADAVKYSGAIAHLVKMPYEELLRIIAFTSDVNLKASTTGRYFVQMMKEFIQIAGDPKLDEFLNYLGLQVDLFRDGKFQIYDLAVALKGHTINIEQLSEIYGELGVRGGTLFALIASNAERFIDLWERTADVQGQNLAAAEQMSLTMENQIKIMKESFWAAFKNQEALTLLSEAVREVSTAFGEIAPLLAGVILKLILYFAENIKPLLEGLLKLVLTFDAMKGDIMALTTTGIVLIKVLSEMTWVLRPLLYYLMLSKVWIGAVALAKALWALSCVEVIFGEKGVMLVLANQTAVLWGNTAAWLAKNAATIIGIVAALAALAVILWMNAEIERQTRIMNDQINTQMKANLAMVDAYKINRDIEKQNYDTARSYDAVNASIAGTIPNLQDYIDAFLILTREGRNLVYVLGTPGGAGVGVGAVENKIVNVDTVIINTKGNAVPTADDLFSISE